MIDPLVDERDKEIVKTRGSSNCLECVNSDDAYQPTLLCDVWCCQVDEDETCVRFARHS